MFLSDHENQAGLVEAADRIKALRDEVSATTNDVNIVVVGDQPEVQSTPGGIAGVLSQWTMPRPPDAAEEESPEEKPAPKTGEQSPLLTAEGLPTTPPRPAIIDGPRGEYAYPLRSDLSGEPRQLSTVAFDIEKVDRFTKDVAGQFPVDNDILALVSKKNEDVIKETVEIFQGDAGMPERLSARIARAELRKEAQNAVPLHHRQEGLVGRG